MFDFLSQKFSSLFSRFNQRSKLTQADVQDVLIKVKDSLLEADVPYDLVESFADSIAKEVAGQQVLSALKPAEQLMKVIHERLLAFLGGKNSTQFSFQLPSVVLIMGLQGSGKTTTLGKLTHYVMQQAKSRGKSRRILLASVDFYRPAAVDQLERLSQQVPGVTFYRAQQAVDPVAAAQEIYAHYRSGSYDLLFLDTAGRLHVDSAMLEELRKIDSLVSPRYKMLVLDSMTGQESLNVARAFDQGVGFSSAILTKMDSDTRGGAAFSFRYALQKPIVFVGTGEKIDNLDQFHPDRAANRMLGMGDLQTLIERADTKIKKEEQERAHNAFVSGRFTLDDFAQQMDMVSRMGSLSSLMKYLPGMGNAQLSESDLHKGESHMKQFRAILGSMTKKERHNPAILDGSRKKRVACGAGVQPSDVNTLIARFEQAQQYVKLLKKSGPFKGLFR